MYNVRENVQDTSRTFAAALHFRHHMSWFFHENSDTRSQSATPCRPNISPTGLTCAKMSMVAEPAYRDKNLPYISGLHVDISPSDGQQFILTKFIPRAAYSSTLANAISSNRKR